MYYIVLRHELANWALSTRITAADKLRFYGNTGRSPGGGRRELTVGDGHAGTINYKTQSVKWKPHLR